MVSELNANTQVLKKHEALFSCMMGSIAVAPVFSIDHAQNVANWGRLRRSVGAVPEIWQTLRLGEA